MIASELSVAFRRCPLRQPLVAMALLASLACAGAVRAQQVVVERRGGAPPIAGRLRSADEDALRLVTESGAEHALRWDVVRTVTPSTETLERLLAPAEALWRARTRIERDDTELAEPILAELFEVYRGRTSETALVVAEGLLRCRVARGDAVGAVVPALEAARLRALGVTTDAFALLEPALDPATLLCPQAPPVLPQGPALERLRHELETWRPSEPTVAAMADLYRRAVEVGADGALEVHADLPPLPAAAARSSSGGPGAEWAGVQLLQQSLAAAAGDAASAAAMRRLVPGDDWRAAWASFFLGVAAMSADDSRVVGLGVLRLLQVPAEHRQRTPWLAGTSLLVAEHAMARLGDAATAEEIRRELRDAYPNHPVNARERLSELAPFSASPAPTMEVR